MATTDNVFSDGTANELATLSGSAGGGYTATLTIGVTVWPRDESRLAGDRLRRPMPDESFSIGHSVRRDLLANS